MRANIAPRSSQDVDVSASVGFVTSNTRFVENDNSFLTVNGSGTASGNLPEEFNRGWFFIPAELFAEHGQPGGQAVHRRVHGNWRPLGLAHPAGPRLATM